MSLSSSSELAVGVEPVELAFDADGFARPAFVADVDFAGRVVAHEDRRQARHDAVVLDELDHLLGELRANLLGQFLAVEDGGGHVVVESQSGESRARSGPRRDSIFVDIRNGR